MRDRLCPVPLTPTAKSSTRLGVAPLAASPGAEGCPPGPSSARPPGVPLPPQQADAAGAAPTRPAENLGPRPVMQSVTRTVTRTGGRGAC